MNASSFIVTGRDGTVAARPGAFTTGTWAKPPANAAPPDWMLTWETREAAQKFANMNGGNVTTVLEFFYSPKRAA